jgi:hypothetical protein
MEYLVPSHMQPKRSSPSLPEVSILVTIIGIILVTAALIDVFQTLFHPAGHGTISDWTAGGVWKAFRRVADRYPRVLTFAGPTAILCIIVDWIVLTLVGFAFIYWPHTISDFSSSAGNPLRAGFWSTLANSIGALSTLSAGVNATVPWLRILRGFEALVGFGILSASISWLLSIYPILETRRSLAHQATLLHHAERQTGLDVVHDASTQAANIMASLAHDLSTLRNQMAQFPIAHYFYIGETKSALAGILPYLAELANRSVANGTSPEEQIAGAVLGGAVEDFAILIAESFLHIPSQAKFEVLLAYARSQMCEPVSVPSPESNPRNKNTEDRRRA